MKFILTSNSYLITKEWSQAFEMNPSKLKVAFIDTAADVYNKTEADWLKADRDALIDVGFTVSDYSLTNKTKKQLVKDLSKFDIFFVSGGNTFYLLEKANQSEFVKLIKEDYYNDIKFHRVIGDFMIQTGDPQSKGKVDVDFVYDAYNNPKNLPIAGTGGPGYNFEDEFNNGYVFDKAGILAMANAGPNTNGSQIFITHLPTPHLNNKHTIFGQVVNGMDIVNAIEQGDVISEIIVK